jgi:histidyl-tRNA synthetase
MDAPIFVKVNEYKNLTAILTKIQSRIEATSKMIDQLDAIKNEEDQRIQEWKDSLDMVQSKVNTVSTALHQE